MEFDTSSYAARLTRAFGSVRCPIELCVERLDGWEPFNAARFSIARSASDLREALEYLSLLTYPATRHVLIPHGEITIFLNNTKGGTEFADYNRWFAERVQAPAARVVDEQDRFWTRGDLRERQAYAARIFELVDESGNVQRSVSCVNDGGRWTFDVSGTPHPVEATFDYSAKRVRDRFTSQNLKTLVQAHGLLSPTADSILSAEQWVLVDEVKLDATWARKIADSACSLAEFDDPAHGYFERGMSWVEHMDTHAASVIADLERAVRINPAYEARVSKYLKAARRARKRQ